MASPDLVTSQVAPQERWLKLYRKIHDLYLKDDFANLRDFETAIKEINARISELEAKMIIELNKIQAAIATHVHTVPQTPAGATVSAPAGAFYTAGYTNTKIVNTRTIFADQRNTVLQATGPGVAPIGGL
jgi:hypothetical protein